MPAGRLPIGARGLGWSLAVATGLLCSAAAAAGEAPAKAAPAAPGPLRVHPDNPRYFAEPGGRAVYLTGAHTWNSLVDMGRGDPPQPFDFDAYLDFLQRHHHNFIRLWTWDSSQWDTRANPEQGQEQVLRAAPLPWLRRGPEAALDGKPKFDLAQFDPQYFRRLRTRVDAAGRRGIYVSVMLFEGWGLMHGNRRKPNPGWAWRSHPFHPSNNVNGVNADVPADARSGPVHSLADPRVNAVQEAYLRKVVDTLNDCPNVLYEVINEGGQQEWDWWVVRTVRGYQQTRPQQHPIGITGHGAERLASMLAGPADWISPGSQDGFRDGPPAWDGRKVSLLDTDHIWGIGGTAEWAWKSFLRGHQPLFMDPYDGAVLDKGNDQRWDPVRRALGQTRRFAERIDLAATRPAGELASSGYCLARAAREDAQYVVFAPRGGEFTVDLSASPGPLAVEWFAPAEERTVRAGTVAGGAVRPFKPPFAGAAVLLLDGRGAK